VNQRGKNTAAWYTRCR